MADKYAAFFIALATSRHIAPTYPSPAPTFVATNPVHVADGRGAALIPLLYTSIWRVRVRIYT